MSAIIELKKDLKKDIAHYRKVLFRLEADVPLQCLCLPKSIENILSRSGCSRVLDVIDLDLTKIKGLGIRRRSLILSRLNEFLSMSF